MAQSKRMWEETELPLRNQQEDLQYIQDIMDSWTEDIKQIKQILND
jgi:hypothetical protein